MSCANIGPSLKPGNLVGMVINVGVSWSIQVKGAAVGGKCSTEELTEFVTPATVTMENPLWGTDGDSYFTGAGNFAAYLTTCRVTPI